MPTLLLNTWFNLESNQDLRRISRNEIWLIMMRKVNVESKAKNAREKD